MKLWDRNQTPMGGWSYFDPVLKRQITVDTNFYELLRISIQLYEANGYEAPKDLKEFIEDCICQKQPPGKCHYEGKIGDGIALVANKVAKAVDTVLKTHLEEATRGCSHCGQRRIALNRLTR